jgi:glycosyltransferase involved in cell wall biosynthesis
VDSDYKTPVRPQSFSVPASDPLQPAPLPSTEVLVAELRKSFSALLVCLSNSWGGLEKVTAGDACDLARLGLQVRLLCLEGSPIHKQLSSQSAVKLVPIDFRPRNYFDFKLRSILQGQIRDGVNLIHTHQTSLLGSIVPWVWNNPAVALFASRHIMNGHDKRDFFHRIVYSRVDKLIVMSQALRRNVMETHAIRERQVKVVNLGLDFDSFDAAAISPEKQRAAWGVDDDTVVIGLVGRIDPAKGQATFIRAAAGLSKNPAKDQKLKFVIVGDETVSGETSHFEELKELVKTFGLEEQVIFTGYRENVPEVMRAFDIFVMPSRQEAFGLVAIEAMAMETPIIISWGGSSYEIVGEQEYGFTMRPDDAFDLQRRLRYLIDHPTERSAMGKRAREHVANNYDRKQRIQKTLALYERALRARGIL